MKATARKTKYGFVGIVTVTDGKCKYTISTEIIRLTRSDALIDAQKKLAEIEAVSK